MLVMLLIITTKMEWYFICEFQTIFMLQFSSTIPAAIAAKSHFFCWYQEDRSCFSIGKYLSG